MPVQILETDQILHQILLQLTRTGDILAVLNMKLSNMDTTLKSIVNLFEEISRVDKA